MGRVTGLGGAFFRAKDPKALYAWYEKHLGLKSSDGGIIFPMGQESSVTVLAFFPESSDYFGAARKGAMMNLRVEDLDGLIASLRAAGADVDPKVDSYDYGKFGWVTDPEGNRVELWEPANEENPGT